MSEGKTLSSGMSLPQWMKTKMNDRLDFDHGTFSPPENDGNFLYIPYHRLSKQQVTINKGQFGPQVEVFTSTPAPLPQPTSGTSLDFSKHTAPCKKFISVTANNVMETKPVPNTATKPKSNGTDDGFKGEAAACGSSVIRMAHQMVTAKLTRGFTISEEEFATPPPGFNPSIRRGSKSLPSSPLTSPNASPKSKRRLPNKYFTDGLVDADKIQGSWILSGLLRKNDKLSRSVNVIAEETPETLSKTVSEVSIDEIPEHKALQKPLKPKLKKAELREMNFWSPTSM